MIYQATMILCAIARAMIKMESMRAENMDRFVCGKAVAYKELEFLKLIDEEGIGHDAVALYLRDK